MSKYAEYMRSIDNNRTIYDFGEVGASVTYDVELNQTEIAFLTRKGDDLDFISRHTFINQIGSASHNGLSFTTARSCQHQSVLSVGGGSFALGRIKFFKQVIDGHSKGIWLISIGLG